MTIIINKSPFKNYFNPLLKRPTLWQFLPSFEHLAYQQCCFNKVQVDIFPVLWQFGKNAAKPPSFHEAELRRGEGGESRIRTCEDISAPSLFESDALNRSAISPRTLRVTIYLLLITDYKLQKIRK